MIEDSRIHKFLKRFLNCQSEKTSPPDKQLLRFSSGFEGSEFAANKNARSFAAIEGKDLQYSQAQCEQN
jgi:hypothetical protein